jgi:hypothetical protein
MMSLSMKNDFMTNQIYIITLYLWKREKKKLNDIQEAYIRFEKLDSQFQKWLGELDQLIMNR